MKNQIQFVFISNSQYNFKLAKLLHKKLLQRIKTGNINSHTSKKFVVLYYLVAESKKITTHKIIIRGIRAALYRNDDIYPYSKRKFVFFSKFFSSSFVLQKSLSFSLSLSLSLYLSLSLFFSLESILYNCHMKFILKINIIYCKKYFV